MSARLTRPCPLPASWWTSSVKKPSIKGPPALVGRTRGGFRCWRSGFSLDHLTRDDVVRLLGILADGAVQPKTFRLPVPTTARAVVLLLHDVEEPLAEDPRGTRSVIDGI